MVDKDNKRLANKVQVLRLSTLPPGMEVQFYCRLVSEPTRHVGLVKNFIQDYYGSAVTGKEGIILVRCIIVTDQPEELCGGSLIGLFLPVDKDQLHESSSVGHCAGFQDGQDMGQCSDYMTTLKVCMTPGWERQFRQLFTTYDDVFSRRKADGGRTD